MIPAVPGTHHSAAQYHRSACIAHFLHLGRHKTRCQGSRSARCTSHRIYHRTRTILSIDFSCSTLHAISPVSFQLKDSLFFSASFSMSQTRLLSSLQISRALSCAYLRCFLHLLRLFLFVFFSSLPSVFPSFSIPSLSLRCLSLAFSRSVLC